MDRNLTVTHNPIRTSFGAVSIQLRTAASTLGMNPAYLTDADWRSLARCLQSDFWNVSVVAQHLRQLLDQDALQTDPPALTMDAVKVVGARYNRGAGLSLDNIRKNTSYGDFIVKHWSRFSGLLT